MKKRILIPYATYGSGHAAIAQYIKKYFEENGDYECLTLDLLSYSFPILGKLSKKLCESLMTKFPFIWSLVYFSFDNKISAYVAGNLSLNLFNNKRLKKDIKEFNPDITIATHFFGSDLITKYNKKGISDSKLITVVTDFKSHDFWLKSLKGIDSIIISSLEEKIHLLRKGFKLNQIHTYGIPIDPTMKDNLNIDKIKNKLKINNNKKTVLFFIGGGNGAISNLTYLKEIIKNNYDCNVLFVCGKNKQAYKMSNKYIKKHKIKNIKVHGFVTNINEFYYVSDFIITKPGGAQITESLFFTKPMLLVKNNGGQEIENKRYLLHKHIAYAPKSTYSFNKYFSLMLNNEKELKKMKENIKKLNNNNSMKKLFDLVSKIK